MANTKLPAAQLTNGLVVFKPTPWQLVITLSNVSTTADTDVDLTSYTSTTATWALLYCTVSSSNTTNATFLQMRKKGDTTAGGNVNVIYCGPTNGYFTTGQFWVPLDANRKFTYNVNANATSFTAAVYLVGYYEPTS